MEERIIDRFQSFAKDVDDRIDIKFSDTLKFHSVFRQNKEEGLYSLERTIAQMNAELINLQRHVTDYERQNEVGNRKTAEWMFAVDSQLHRKDAESIQRISITSSNNDYKKSDFSLKDEMKISVEADERQLEKSREEMALAYSQSDRKAARLVQPNFVTNRKIKALKGELSSDQRPENIQFEREKSKVQRDDVHVRTTTTQTDSTTSETEEKRTKALHQVEDIEAFISSERKLVAENFQKRLNEEINDHQQIIDVKLNTNQQVIEEKIVTVQRAIDAKLRSYQQTVDKKLSLLEHALRDAEIDKKHFNKTCATILPETERDKHFDEQFRKLRARMKSLEDDLNDIKGPLSTMIINLGEENAALMEEIQRTQVEIEPISLTLLALHFFDSQHESRQLMLQYKNRTESQHPTLFRPPRPMSANNGRSSSSARVQSASNTRRQESMPATSHSLVPHDTISEVQGWPMDNKTKRKDSTLNLINSPEPSQKSTDKVAKFSIHKM